LIKEGNDYVFPHRSFQEYFAAYCLSFVTRKNFKNIVIELAKRPNEQAVVMIRDMNPELLRDEFVVPMAVKYKAALKNVASEKNVALFMEAADMRFDIAMMKMHNQNNMRVHILINEGGELENIARTFERLGGKGSNYRSARTRSKNDKLEPAVRALFTSSKLASTDRITIWAQNGILKLDVIRRKGSKLTVVSPEVEANLTAAMMDSFVHGYVSPLMKNAARYADKQLASASLNTSKMTSIFGDPV